MLTKCVEVAGFPFCSFSSFFFLFFSFLVVEREGIWTQVCLSKTSRDLIFGALKNKITKYRRKAWKISLWKDYSDQLPGSRNKKSKM